MDAEPGRKLRAFELSLPAPGVRLDRYLTHVLPQFSRAYLQRSIEQGHVLVNGQREKASYRLDRADKVTVELLPQAVRPQAEPIPLAIAYEDEDIVVIDKPAGLTVNPTPAHVSHTLVNAVLAHCPGLAMEGDALRPGIIHRLDKDTSGLIVVAKNDLARRYVSAQFKNRTVNKAYLVLVKGRLSPEQGIIEASIGRDPRSRRRMAIAAEGREATTRYRVREYLRGYTLVEVTPVTGRTHQIRVHLSAIGYPVVGDPVYGTRSAHLDRQFVHAHRLGFRLPLTGQYKEFTSPLPHDLELALDRFCRQ